MTDPGSAQSLDELKIVFAPAGIDLKRPLIEARKLGPRRHKRPRGSVRREKLGQLFSHSLLVAEEQPMLDLPFRAIRIPHRTRENERLMRGLAHETLYIAEAAGPQKFGPPLGRNQRVMRANIRIGETPPRRGHAIDQIDPRLRGGSFHHE